MVASGDGAENVGVTIAPPSRPASSPPAIRGTRPTWRDPRLAVGLALVCISVLVGARVLAAADDSAPVLAARAPLAAGQRVAEEDLVTVRLRFASDEDADRYLGAGTDLGEDAVLVRAVGAGELLPRAALTSDGEAGLVEVPLSLDPGRVPAAVRAGSTVDVWVSSSGDGEGGSGRAERLLSGVPVLWTSRPVAAGPGGLRQVVVGVPSADEPRLARVVPRLVDESLLLVRRPG